jgi:hypothetical protein
VDEKETVRKGTPAPLPWKPQEGPRDRVRKARRGKVEPETPKDDTIEVADPRPESIETK